MMTDLLRIAPLSVTAWIVQMLAYHGIGLCFEWLDGSGRLARFKTRERERKPYLTILPRVLFNQTFILLPAMVFMQWVGLAFVGPAHIGPVIWIVALAVIPIGHDVVQYAGHRLLLHRPELMGRLGHSVHHSTTASCSISACYMSAADFFLEISCPYLIPLAIVGGGGSDMTFHFFVVIAGAFGGLYEHSGFDFSLALAPSDPNAPGGGLRGRLATLLSSRAHAEHHARGNVSFSDGFGSSSLCDTLFRTRWDMVRARVRRRPASSEA